MAGTLDNSQRILDLFEDRYESLFEEAKRTLPHSDAEATCQDLFVELADRATENDLDQLESDGGLLSRLLRSRISRRLRPLVRLHKAVTGDGSKADSRPSPAGLRRLDKSFQSLSHDEHLAVRLAVCEGIPRDGASQRMGVSQQLLEVWINRGLRKLRQYM